MEDFFCGGVTKKVLKSNKVGLKQKNKWWKLLERFVILFCNFTKNNLFVAGFVKNINKIMWGVHQNYGFCNNM